MGRVIVGFCELPSRHVRDAEIENLAGAYQAIERIHHFLEVGRGIPDVSLIEVNVVRLQPP
jgi:cell division ATPase FtsA